MAPENIEAEWMMHFSPFNSERKQDVAKAEKQWHEAEIAVGDVSYCTAL